MRLAALVSVADEVAATSSRTAKRSALAGLLRDLHPEEIAAAVGFLVGEPGQCRIGVGWATVAAIPEAGDDRSPPLDIIDLDEAITRLAGTSGPGSVAARTAILGGLFARATPPEAAFMRRLLVGELRQGALEGVMADAVAEAASVPATLVRRAMMLSGDVRRTAQVALTAGRPGLESIGLTVFQPVQPMLASTADQIDDALSAGRPASVEWKLDGARIQVHRRGDLVRVYTRNLNEVTDRLPEVVDVVRSLPVDELVLDGEVLGLEGARPEAFQQTMSRFGRDDPATHGLRLRPFFFDVLRADGTDLLDEPLSDRLGALDAVAGPHAMPRLVTADAGEAAAFVDATLAAGHEGVMVKDLASAYSAGRRGKAWRKVKPVHTFDLVVLAAEWGHGRRRGWLSNLHLGARDPSDGSFVMVGKTFKGLTDELLTWQTAAFLEREIGRDEYTVHLRPDLVVEVAIDGVQASTRYPGGVALRFARVKRYREDKLAADADTIGSLQAMLV
ncbi:MAG: ATP-dependent DNA ligase [Acidimicrobiales bacterium]